MTERQKSGISLLESIRSDLPKLSRACRHVGDYLIAAPQNFMHNALQEIARAASVSEPTVIRFCRHYGFGGMADFRIALAMSLAGQAHDANTPYLEPNVTDKAVVNLAQKLAIAKQALPLIKGDRSVIIDSGSTTQLFAKQLHDAPPLVVMTTGLNIVQALRSARQHTVLLPGGTVRFESMSLSGKLVEATLSDMRFDTLYLGADSIDATMGLSTFNEAESRQNAAMIRVATRVIVLADSTKFRAPALHHFCDLSRIHTIVTDTGLPDATVELLNHKGVQVLRAVPSGEFI